MRPDDFSRPSSNSGGMQPNRPMQDFRPQPRPVRRPMNDFGPKPQSRPQPQAAPQASQFPQLRQQQAQPVQTAPSPMTFEPKQNTKNKKKYKKKLLISAAAILLIAGGFVFMNLSSSKSKPEVKAQIAPPTVKPLEKPEFTTYYPSPMPSGLKVSKGSISYYKDSFTYIIEQNGQKSFFVYEQPANTDPDFNNLKSKLAAPKSINLTVGQGVEGGLDNGTITAVKTDKNTIIIINCAKTICSTLPRDLLSNMQVNDDLNGLRRAN